MEKKTVAANGSLQLGQRTRPSISSFGRGPPGLGLGPSPGSGLGPRDDPEKVQPQVPNSKGLDLQLQWQQWQNRQRRAQEKQANSQLPPVPPPPPNLPELALETLAGSDGLKGYDSPFKGDDPSTQSSTSSEDDPFTYRNSVSSLASLVSQMDVTYTLSQFSKGDESEPSYTSSTTSSFDDDITTRRILTNSEVAVEQLDSCLNTLANLAQSLDPPNLQPTSASEDETSSSGEDLSSLSSALGGISIDFNFSTSLRGNAEDSENTSSYTDTCSTTGSDSESDSSTDFSLSNLKGLAGDLNFDISTDESDNEQNDSFESEEGVESVLFLVHQLRKSTSSPETRRGSCAR